jgi:hypothetical protein
MIMNKKGQDIGEGITQLRKILFPVIVALVILALIIILVPKLLSLT